MLKEKFEKIAGYEVSDKERFALKPLNEIEKEMKEIALIIKDTHYTDYDKLNELASEYTNRLGAKGFVILDEEKQYCYFPYRINIYNHLFTTVKVIELLKDNEI